MHAWRNTYLILDILTVHETQKDSTNSSYRVRLLQFVLTAARSGGEAPEVQAESEQKEYGKKYDKGSRKRQQPNKMKKRQKIDRGKKRKEDMEPD